MKTALVTGVTGQDGALLSRFLIERGYRVVGMARRTSTPSDWRLRELRLLREENFILASGDLTDQGSLDRIVSLYTPDEIYNLAAQSFVGASWSNPIQTGDVTGMGAVRIYEAAHKFAPEARIYQASSSEMFGGPNRTETLDEESRFYPRSPYGAAKAYAHHMAINYRESYGMHVSCGILFNHESEFRGLEFVTRKVTDGFVRIAFGMQRRVKLGCLDSVRDWGYAPDFVQAMYAMLQQEDPDDFVIATGVTHTIEDLCRAAHRAVINRNKLSRDWREHIEIDQEFSRPADVKHLKGDYSKAKEKLGWSPATSFEKMVEKMVQADTSRIFKATR